MCVCVCVCVVMYGSSKNKLRGISMELIVCHITSYAGVSVDGFAAYLILASRVWYPLKNGGNSFVGRDGLMGPSGHTTRPLYSIIRMCT